MKGKVSSIESMGLVDGPGIRSIFFLSGCPLSCIYCHNPETQRSKNYKEMSVDDIVKLSKRYNSYYKASGGGVTFSGGEPFLQGKFLLEAVKALKAEGISVAIDTCGVGDKRYYKEILENIDYLILDIKHYSEEGYKDITSINMDKYNEFLTYLKYFKGKLILRHVMVPGITDEDVCIENIIRYLKDFPYPIYEFEILPYHTMGIEKYERLNIDYKLKGVKDMSKDKALNIEKHIKEKIKIYA